MKKLIFFILLSMSSLLVMAQASAVTVADDSLSMHKAAAQQDSLGALLYSKGQFAEAQRCFREAASWRKRLLGRRSSAYLRSVTYLASSYLQSGDVKQAIAVGDSLIQLITDSVSANYADLYDVYTNQMYCYYALRRMDKAIEYAHKAVDVLEHQDKMYVHSYVHALANLGYCLDVAKRNDEAKRYLDHAVAIARDSLKPTDNAALEVMNSQAYNYSYRGDYGKAIEIMYEVVQRTREASPESPNLAVRLAALSYFYAAIENYEGAINVTQEVLQLYKKFYGEDSFNYNDLGQRLGNYYRESGRVAEALPYHQRAVEVAEKTYGKQHREYALALGNLAADYHRMDSIDKALELYTEAVRCMERADLEAALILEFNVTNVLADAGRFNEALPQAEQIIQTFRDSVGTYNRDFPVALGHLAGLYRQAGDFDKSLKAKRELVDIVAARVNRIFPSLTERARAEYYGSLRHHFNYIIPCALQDNTPFATTLLYDANLINKGLLLSSSIEFARYVEQSGNKELIANYKQLRKEQIALQQARQLPPRMQNQDSIRIRQAIVDDLEQKVMTQCHEYGSFMDRLRINTADVRKALKKGEVAIEFMQERGRKANGEFVALILRPEWTAPKLVQIPNKEYLQEFVDMRAKTYLNTQLSDTIWKDIIRVGQIKPTDKVYFAPDGPLYQLAIEYLPYTAQYKGAVHISTDTVMPTMADVYNLYRMSSTRELCFRNTDAFKLEKARLREAVLYGGVYYNPENKRGAIQYLPGTLNEVQAIAEQIGAKNMFTAMGASEEQFKQMSGQAPELMHIATHGFCLSDVTETNAMQRTGMLLANSESAWKGEDVNPSREDGILTAQEIAGLNLTGNQLTVLSACETALGAITSDGVMGLQRGFKKAGVHALIMSLWPVNDEATEKMMKAFYLHLNEGMTPREALRAAQYDLRGFKPEPIEEGDTEEVQGRKLNFLRQSQVRAAKKAKKFPFAHPRYWAAFILLDATDK
ncbi:MAG: CHAT domain-containing protein [Paludibacteraceae bacterium]|nr:CHAT domain-containing protein [Paludibacteraceae bacterium]